MTFRLPESFKTFAVITAGALLLFACGSSEKEVEVNLEPMLSDGIYSEFVSQWDGGTTNIPESGCEPMKTRLPGTFAKMFDDMNPVHLESAKEIGISPANNLSEFWTNTSSGLVKIRSCPKYYIAPLTHSYPYLVPEAARLLNEIGSRFADSLQAHGGGAYRPRVTSVYRTPSMVKKLKKVNVNSSENSSHFYGTTFDISYSKFVCDDSTQTRRSQEDLKNMLARVLIDLKEEGMCLVKYERKQACFHITANSKYKR